MGYLSDYEHDIFVSYAHSDLLSDWSKDLIALMRGLIAGGLGLREAAQIGLWWDNGIRGNEPLTRQVRQKAERSAVLLVLMTEWYLESSWCRDELQWFVNAIQQKRADRPVFVVRVRSTDHTKWPDIFRDERGHPLIGYDFVRDNTLGLPKGYPTPKDAPDSKEYYDALSKLATDIVLQLKALADVPQPDVRRAQPATARADERHQESVFVAAAPAEDVDDLRDELARLLRASGCAVVPEKNPLDVDQIHEQAGKWVASCDKFVQVLGSISGSWPHDDTGFVIYQYQLAKKNDKPIFVYRAPGLETSRVKRRHYREFLERFDHEGTGDLQTFAKQVASFAISPDGDRNVFMVASPRDQSLERELRRLLHDLDITVFPLYPANRAAGGLWTNVLDEGSSFLEVLRRCSSVLLINSKVKEEDVHWIDQRIADFKFDIQRKLGRQLHLLIVDGPEEPRFEQRGGVAVLAIDSPDFSLQLLGSLQVPASLAPNRVVPKKRTSERAGGRRPVV